MIGTYSIYKNKVLVAKKCNLITTFGQTYILGYLASQVPTIGSAIAVGTSNTAANVADLTLGFEFSRGTIDIRSINSGTVLMKASLDTTVGGLIYELGLFPTVSNSAAGQYGTKMLAQCDPTLEAWSVGVANTSNFRIGTASLELDVTSGTTVNSLFSPFTENLSGYSVVDQFSLGYFINDVHASNITIQFQTDAADYYQYSFSPSTISGYHIQSWNKTNFTTVGSPDISNINSVNISVTAAGGNSVVEIDGLLITDKDIYQDYGLISHAILGSPVSKAPDETLDVEYSLAFTVNG